MIINDESLFITLKDNDSSIRITSFWNKNRQLNIRPIGARFSRHGVLYCDGVFHIPKNSIIFKLV